MVREAKPSDRTAPEASLAFVTKALPIFSRLNPSDQATLARAAVRRTFEKGENIARYGENWDHALLVVEGVLRMVKGSKTGRVLAAVTLGPGDVFFAHSLFDSGPLPASIEAETRCAVYQWDGADIVPILKANPAALWQVCAVLAQQMRRASEVIDTLAFHPLTSRLARLLLEHFDQGSTEPAPRSLTLDDMAARVGTTREVVCRLLYKLSDDGIINITRTDFAFLNKERLAELADGF